MSELVIKARKFWLSKKAIVEIILSIIVMILVTM